jgi:hypothetical protein
MSSTTRETARSKPGTIHQYDSGFQNGEAIQTTYAPAVYSIVATNKSAGTLYAMLWDAATLPTDGTAPTIVPIAVPAGATIAVQFNEQSGDEYSGLQMSAGLAWCGSSTASTKTIDTTSSLWLAVRYG